MQAGSGQHSPVLLLTRRLRSPRAMLPCFQHSSAARIGGFRDRDPHRVTGLLQKNSTPRRRCGGARQQSWQHSTFGEQWPYPDTGA